MSRLRILVLCAGNIGRSPLAEAMLARALAEGLGVGADDLAAAGVVVLSAGTDAPEGHPASSRGIALAAEEGLDLSGHRATRLTAAAARDADVIYGMDKAQLAGVSTIVPTAGTKTQLLAGEGIEIPDPHYQSDEFFREVAVQVEQAAQKRAEELLALLRTLSDD